MKSPIRLYCFFLAVCLSYGTLIINCQSREISIINASWKFSLNDDPNSYKSNFDDSNWEVISLPHTWNNMDGQDGGDNYYRGTGWYRKSLHLNNVTGRSVFLKFNSVNLLAEVYVNDSLVGHHIGGYSAFIFEISKFVKSDFNNIIAVKVSNSAALKYAPLSADFTFCGGITRSVELWVTNNVLVSPMDYASPGVYITPENISQSYADINIKVLLGNYSNLNKTISESYIIKNALNVIVNSISAISTLSPQNDSLVSRSLSVLNPVLWKGMTNPYLYTLEVILKVDGNEVDRLSQKFGIRTIDADPDSGIYLNGKKYPLHGIAFHEDRKNKGRAISDIDRKEDLSILSETGLNYLRLAHYQHGQYTYNYCDSAGIVVWTEIPLVNETDTSNSNFSNNIKEQLKELIKQNYNHPSVCFWGLFNEKNNTNINATQLITALKNLAKSLDSKRFTVGAANQDDPQNKVPDLLSWNLYYGWYYGNITDINGSLSYLHFISPHTPIGLSEYGAGASIIHHEENPAKPIYDGDFHPEEYQNIFHEEHWKAIKERPYLWESSVWVGFDFASDKKSEGDSKGINDKGLVTRDRLIRKDAYFFYKANWSSSSVVYISSRRFTNRNVASTSIKIYSNNDSVQLFVNSKSYGFLKSSDHIFIKNTILDEGSNKIKAIGIKNGIYTKDSCIWNLDTSGLYKDIKINFETSSTSTPAGFIADKGDIYGSRGSDLTYGWNKDNTLNARERNLTVKKEFDTFNHLQYGGINNSWEIAVVNGKYLVNLACGDPAYFDSHHKLMIENKLMIDGITDAASPWLIATDTVSVTDGKLTVYPASGAINTKINYIHLTWIDSTYLTISTDQLSIGAESGSHASFDITSNTSWTIGSSQSWLTADIASGAGSAHITLTSGANTGITTRSATVTISAVGIANKTITVTQDGATPVLSVSTDHLSIGADSGSHANFDITSNTSWTIGSSQSWLTADIASGTGSAHITLTSGANTGITTRSATVTISSISAGNKTIAVTQDGATPILSVSTDQLYVGADSGSHASFDITSNTSWAIGSSQSWLTADIASGTGSAHITLTSGANTDIATRSATVTISAVGIANKTITITQFGTAPVLSVSTDQLYVGADSGSHASFDITSNTSWAITTNVDWMSLNLEDGSLDTTIIITVAGNIAEISRDALITISVNNVSSKSIGVTQSGKTTSAISEIKNSDLLIYPNPFSDQLTIVLQNASFKTFLEIYSIQGEVLFNLTLDKGMLSIDMNDYPAGLYTIKIISKEQVMTRKVLKQ
jgi:beta-galactosidase